MTSNRKKITRFLLSTLVIALLTVMISEFTVFISSTMVRSPLKGLENQIVDLSFQTRVFNDAHQKVKPEDIVIIDIDDASIQQLGRPHLWPRAYDAFVIRYVSEGKPHGIGIDYIYAEPDTLTPIYVDILKAHGIDNGEEIIRSLSTDIELSYAIEDAGMVYLALFDDDQPDPVALDTSNAGAMQTIPLTDDAGIVFKQINKAVLPIPEFANYAAGVGTIDMTTTIDGTVRNYRLLQELPTTDSGRHLVGNFPLYMLIDALDVPIDSVQVKEGVVKVGDKIEVPLQEDGKFRINWLGREEKIRYISFYKVLQGRMPNEFFKDKYIFFGTSASGMEDLKTVPSDARLMPGVEVHAVAFLNMMNEAFIREISETEALPWFFLIALGLVGLFTLVKPFLGFVLDVVIILAQMFLFILWYLPSRHTVFPIVTLMLISIFAYLLSSLYTYFIRERKSRRLKTAFGSYVSPDVVEKISRESDTVSLSGEKKELTVLFSDIRSFTSYSEQIEPEEIVAMLNEYLSEMSECILREKGTIDKFIGDAIMAIWGAPVPQEDHALRACQAALGMMEALKRFNDSQNARGKKPIQVGIGINTGNMTVGNIGSEKRFDYTVIGDEVNLGARLEGLTKYFAVDTLVSDGTLKSCPADYFKTRPIGMVVVQGREQSVLVHELIGKQDQTADDQNLAEWHKALNAFWERDFDKAISGFRSYQAQNPSDKPTAMYLELCERFIQDPSQFTAEIRMEKK